MCVVGEMSIGGVRRVGRGGGGAEDGGGGAGRRRGGVFAQRRLGGVLERARQRVVELQLQLGTEEQAL